MHTTNASGSFLIRESISSPGDHSLAVKSAEKVRHHRIQKLDSGNYFVTPQVTFASIPELVAYYSEQSDLLKNPCCIVEKPDIWEIDRKSISLVKKLGVGQFSEVWQGVWNSTNEVAVKILKPDTIGVQKHLQEAALMKKLRHPKLIQLYAVCTKEEPIYIITEWMKHGSLLEYLRGDGRSLRLPQVIDMGVQVAAGMAYLEEQCHIH